VLGIEWHTATIAASLHYTHTNTHTIYTICFFFLLFRIVCCLAMFKKVIFNFWWSILFFWYSFQVRTERWILPFRLPSMFWWQWGSIQHWQPSLPIFSPLSPIVVLVRLILRRRSWHLTTPPCTMLHQSTHAQPDRSVYTALLSRIFVFLSSSAGVTATTQSLSFVCVCVCVCVCKRMETGDFCPLELCIRVLMKEGQNMN
jgi:hypothetical protein